MIAKVMTTTGNTVDVDVYDALEQIARTLFADKGLRMVTVRCGETECASLKRSTEKE